VADVADQVAGAAGQAHAAGLERALEGGRIGRQEVGRRSRTGHDVRREPGLLGPVVAAPVAHRGDDPVQRLRGGQITLSDHPERRVGRPRRIGETPVALGWSYIRQPPRDTGQFHAQPGNFLGYRRALAQRRGQPADRAGQRRYPDGFTTVDRFGCSGRHHRCIRAAHAYTSGSVKPSAVRSYLELSSTAVPAFASRSLV
jgi:hypothetical protein